MSTKLIVGNLSLDINPEELEKAFSEFGSVDHVLIETDPKTGRSKGFAFIHMAARRQAEVAASHLNGADMGGRPVTVSLFETPEKPLSLFGRCLKLLQT
jgi:RNA recognition motif-containing protein